METCGRWNEGKSFPQNDGRTCVCTTFHFLAPAQLLTSWKGSRHLSPNLVLEDYLVLDIHHPTVSRHSSTSREFLPSGLDCVRYSVGPWRGQHFGGEGHIRKTRIHTTTTLRPVPSLHISKTHLLIFNLVFRIQSRSRTHISRLSSRGSLSVFFVMPGGRAWVSNWTKQNSFFKGILVYCHLPSHFPHFYPSHIIIFTSSANYNLHFKS